MSIVPDAKAKNFNQILTRQTTVIATVMAALAKIDEARLRRQRQSGIERVLQEIRAFKARAP